MQNVIKESLNLGINLMQIINFLDKITKQIS